MTVIKSSSISTINESVNNFLVVKPFPGDCVTKKPYLMYYLQYIINIIQY